MGPGRLEFNATFSIGFWNGLTAAVTVQVLLASERPGQPEASETRTRRQLSGGPTVTVPGPDSFKPERRLSLTRIQLGRPCLLSRARESGSEPEPLNLTRRLVAREYRRDPSWSGTSPIEE